MSLISSVSTWLKFSVAPPLGALLIRAIGKTMRLFTIGGEGVDVLYQDGKQIIIVFWHGRQIMMPLAYRGAGASILISQHGDGEMIARMMNPFGFRAIRGSTTRGGIRAFRHLLHAARKGEDLVITPDGPKGPVHKVQLGVMALAKITGWPIVPLTFASSKKKSF